MGTPTCTEYWLTEKMHLCVHKAHKIEKDIL